MYVYMYICIYISYINTPKTLRDITGANDPPRPFRFTAYVTAYVTVCVTVCETVCVTVPVTVCVTVYVHVLPGTA